MNPRVEIFVMTAPGVEGLLAREIAALGMKPREIVSGGVTVTGAANEIQRLNLHSRIANRVIVRVAEFHASSFYELERRAKKIEWQRFIAEGQPVRFRSRGSGTRQGGHWGEWANPVPRRGLPV